MNQKIWIPIIIIVAIVAGVAGYQVPQIVNDIQIDNHISDNIQDRPWAREIASQGVDVVVEDIPDSENGDVIRGQAWFQGSRCVKVIIDVAVGPDEIDAVGWHEAGHVWYENNDPENNDEAHADQYAEEHGYHIVDKYHGVH